MILGASVNENTFVCVTPVIRTIAKDRYYCRFGAVRVYFSARHSEVVPCHGCGTYFALDTRGVADENDLRKNPYPSNIFVVATV